MRYDRRDFLIRSAAAAAGVSTLGLLKGCLLGDTAGQGYRIDEEACTGCGDCQDVCPHDAVDLPRRTVHRVDAEKCNPFECDHECVDACPEEAIFLFMGSAHIDHSLCTTCGDCVDACEEFDAIEVDPQKAEILRPPCEGLRCGLCVPICRWEAIKLTDLAGAQDDRV